MTVRIIRAVNFLEDAVTIEYVTPEEDVKANGVTVNHALMVPAGDDYDDEIEAVFDAVQALLADVLEDLPRLEPVDLTPDDPDTEDDDE